MAIRFKNAIDNSIETVKNSMGIKVKDAQEEMQRLLDKIMKHKDDMIDVIDTWRYIKEKRLDRYFSKKLVWGYGRVHSIVVRESEDTIVMRFNDWKEEGGGPYDWYVLFDGEDVKIYISNMDEMATVKDMISNALFDKANNYVIMPIINKRSGYYTKHEYTKPMEALAFFANHIENFCTDFFNEAQNITLKSR